MRHSPLPLVRPATLVALFLAALAVLGAGASPASAVVREGSGPDASGDSAGGANRDIVEGSFQYDSNGQIEVSATMAAPIDPNNADAHIYFSVRTANADGRCTGDFVISFSGGFSDKEGAITVTGVSRYGRVATVISGARIAFGFSSNVIANKDLRCVTAYVSQRDNTTPEFRDELQPDVFAAGFGPDRDGDGKADNVDACPDQFGALANGCPSDPDGDGKVDSADACPDQAADTANGCPAPVTGGTGTGTGSASDTTGPQIALPSSNKSLIASKTGQVRFKIGPSEENTTGTLLLKTAGKVKTATGKRRVVSLGTKSFQALDGQTATVRINLSKPKLKLLRRLKRLRAQANITLRDSNGNATIKKYTFTIKAPRR